MSMLSAISDRLSKPAWLGNFLLGSVCVFGVLALFSYYTHSQRLDSDIRQVETYLGEESERLNTRVQESIDTARYIAGLNSITSAARSNTPNQADAVQALHQLMSIHENFLQARLISLEGQELIRAQRQEDNEFRILTRQELQNKAKRYYVQKGLLLKPNSYYVSPIDFNQEHGELEIPLRAVIRVVAPVFDQQQTLLGLFVINYDFRALMQGLSQHFGNLLADAWIISSQGYWLMPTTLDSLGDNKPTQPTLFNQSFAAAWQAIVEGQTTQIDPQHGYFHSLPIQTEHTTATQK